MVYLNDDDGADERGVEKGVENVDMYALSEGGGGIFYIHTVIFAPMHNYVY